MTAMFVDASALTAITVGEDDADELTARLEGATPRCTSAIALWETAAAVARIKKVGAELSWEEVGRFVRDLAIQVMPLTEREAKAAFHAHISYGKRSGHPARLNMGDCFAYACAKIQGTELLYKGDDFAHTDLG